MTIAQLALSPEASALYALVVAGLEKKFQFIQPVVKYVQSHKGLAKEVETGAIAVATEILHSPEAAKLKAELAHRESELRDTRLFQVAGTVLHSFQKSLDSLTDDEKSTAALLISTEAKKLFGLTVSTGEALGALNKLQSSADAIANSDLFKTTQQLAQVKQAVTASATVPAQQVSDPQGTPTPNGQPVSPAVS